MPRTIVVPVRSKPRGMWRASLVAAVGRFLPRPWRIAACRWAVRRVRVEVQVGNAKPRLYDPGFDIEVRR